jgi:hypothetical protein
MSISQILTSFALGAGLGLVISPLIAAFWAPFLVSHEVMEMISRPFDYRPFNYLSAFAVISMLHFGLLSMLLFNFGSMDTTMTIILGLGIWIPNLSSAVFLYLRRRQGFEHSRWLGPVLFLGCLWYWFYTTAPLVFVAMFYYLPT